MRKQTKLVAVLSAAALLAMGATMTSFAAQGWQEENGTWVYYDKNNDKVTDTWAKSGNNWFYLNGDGEMATDELIDDGSNYYYVNSDGVMVANAWVAIENENAGDEDEPASYWYYFQNNGKAYKASSSGTTSFKTINGKKYAFQDDGKMLYGWVDGSASRVTGDTAWQSGTYFCGDENDGAMATGWARIDVVDPENEDGEDQSYWFYFNPSNGKKTVDADAKGINGKKYAFNSYGVMQSKWYEAGDASASTASIGRYKYFNDPEEGWRLQKGWVKVVPQEDVNNKAYNDDSTKWFYADGSGVIYKSALKTINGKKYAFNDKGEMLSGLWALKLDGSNIKGYKEIDSESVKNEIKGSEYAGYAVYYFGGGDDGAAKTGNQSVDIDGDAYSYSFKTTGATKYQGLDGIVKNVLYVNGEKIKADKDLRYQSFTIDGIEKDGKLGGYLLNTSGTLMKSKNNVKDADDYYYCTNANGIVTYYGAEKAK